jgi:hypothetical protein
VNREAAGSGAALAPLAGAPAAEQVAAGKGGREERKP